MIMKNSFEIKDLGSITNCLGLDVQRDRNKG